MLAVGDAAFQQKCFDAVRAAQGARAGRSSSSPTTWARSSASATARCCSSAARCSRSATRTRSRAPTTSSTSAGVVDAAPTRRRATATARRRRSRTPGSRTTRASGSSTLAQGEHVHGLHRGRRSTSRSTTRSSPSTLRNEVAPHVFVDLARDWRHEPDRHFAAGETRDGARRASTTGSRRAATRSRPSVARAGTGATARPARGPRRAARARHARHRRRRRPAARARDRAPMTRQRRRGRHRRPSRRRRPPPLLEPHAGRSRSPTSSCASTARRSATCGRWSGRCALRRALLRLHRGRRASATASSTTPSTSCSRSIAVPRSSRRSTGDGAACAGRPREPAAQDALPAARDPALGRADARSSTSA